MRSHFMSFNETKRQWVFFVWNLGCEEFGRIFYDSGITQVESGVSEVLHGSNEIAIAHRVTKMIDVNGSTIDIG